MCRCVASDQSPEKSAGDSTSAKAERPDVSLGGQPAGPHSHRSSRRPSRSTSPRKGKAGMDALLAFFGDGYELFEVGNGGEMRKLDTVPDQKALRSHKRNFILRRRTAHQKAHEAERLLSGQFTDANVDRFDYDKRYPPDKPGKEKEPGAKIWRVYMDEAGQFDLDMVENMRDTVDVILVFAGLFSAIVTSLVALTATALQLDQPKVTNLLLMELIALQRASITGDSIDQIIPSPLNAESPSNSTAETTDYWINGLWFTSLAFGLSTALIAVLVKQWIQAYVAPSFQGTPKSQAEVRHFRYSGIETGHVPIIIGLLPTFLHLSLFLFFAGLVVFLFTLDITIASVVTGITSVSCIAYLVTNLLPVLFAGCPYRTPLSHYAFFILNLCKTRYTSFWSNRSDTFGDIWIVFIAAFYLPSALAIRFPWYLFTRPSATLWDFIISPIQSVNYFRLYPHRRKHKPKSLKDMESQAIMREGDELHSQMFGWLILTSAANPSAKSAVLSCVTDSSNMTHLQPPVISLRADFNKVLQRIISFNVTNSEATLDRARVEAVFAGIPNTDLHANQSVVDGLLAVHKYCKTASLSFIHPDETFNVSSDVDWTIFGSALAGEVYLQRFCLHILSASPPTLSLDHAPYSSDDVVPLLPAIYRWTLRVHPTPDALHMLKRWFPVPAMAGFLDDSVTSVGQLRVLLKVGAFLLSIHGLELIDAFEEAESLVFWRLVYKRHNNSISQDLVKGFHDMIDQYIYQIQRSSQREPQDHLHHVFQHLQTIFLWHATLPADEPMHYYMTLLAREDPWNPMWQVVQNTLPDLLLTAKKSGAALFTELAIVLQREREKQPRSLQLSALPGPSPLINKPLVRSAVGYSGSNNTAALAVDPSPDTALVSPAHDNVLDLDIAPQPQTLPGPGGQGPRSPNAVDMDTAPLPIGVTPGGSDTPPDEALNTLYPPLDEGSNAAVPTANTIPTGGTMASVALDGSPMNGPVPGSTTSGLTLWTRARRRLNLHGYTDGDIV